MLENTQNKMSDSQKLLEDNLHRAKHRNFCYAGQVDMYPVTDMTGGWTNTTDYVSSIIQGFRTRNGISQACYIVEIYHSGLEPSNMLFTLIEQKMDVRLTDILRDSTTSNFILIYRSLWENLDLDLQRNLWENQSSNYGILMSKGHWIEVKVNGPYNWHQ